MVMTCKNCAVMHQKNSTGICRCHCHMPQGISGSAYQAERARQMREHIDTIASNGYGSSYF